MTLSAIQQPTPEQAPTTMVFRYSPFLLALRLTGLIVGIDLVLTWGLGTTIAVMLIIQSIGNALLALIALSIVFGAIFMAYTRLIKVRNSYVEVGPNGVAEYRHGKPYWTHRWEDIKDGGPKWSLGPSQHYLEMCNGTQQALSRGLKDYNRLLRELERNIDKHRFLPKS